jgi:ribA/ribD-fused uncharacterized protein
MDVLRFYSGSKDKNAGHGTGENVSDDQLYEELNKIRNWRQVLSNFHIFPFTYDNKKYNSIEHAFQAQKILLADAEKASWFEIENKIGDQAASVARKNRKLVVLSPSQLFKWDTTKDNIMKQISIAKYRECDEARKVLLQTKDAQLWHIVPRGKPIRFIHLEEIRDDLNDKGKSKHEYTDPPENYGQLLM